MELNLCIPTLNRYDLLEKLITSLQQSEVKPTGIWVIDNGDAWKAEQDTFFRDEFGIYHHYKRFGHNLGVAASWNHFIRSVFDIRVICNDDIVFAPDALGKLVERFDRETILSPAAIIGGNAFSCFTFPDGIVRRVGLFDENISPNYAYLEDNDMARRLLLAESTIQPVHGCNVEHGLSSTLKAYTDEQRQEHHRKFERAIGNYEKKWGGMPGKEKYITPYGATTESSS